MRYFTSNFTRFLFLFSIITFIGLVIVLSTFVSNISVEAYVIKTPTKTPTSTSTMYVNATTNVNMRSCAATSCSVVTTVKPGEPVRVLGEDGDWYKVKVGTKTGYIAGFLLTNNKPSVKATQSSQQSHPTVRPATVAPGQQSQPVSTQKPVQAPTQQEQPSGPSCNGATTCAQMSSCAQAYACLAEGRSSLDRDKDGVPCESICGG